MSDSKLSDLTAATSVAPADLAYVVQGGTSKKATREILQTYDAGTLTTDKKVLDLSATWNAAGVTFTGVKFNVTNTASASGSKVFDFQIGGTSQLALTGTGLGVGTASPGYKLDVSGSARVSTSFAVGGAPTGYGVLQAVSNDTNTAPRQLSIRGTTDGNKNLWLGYNTTNNYGAIQAYRDGTGASPLVLQPEGGLVTFAGATSSFPALKRSSTTLQVRLADDSGDAPFSSGRATIQTLTVGLGGSTSVASNTAVGFEALNSASLTGTQNSGVGHSALKSVTSGSDNSALGVNALIFNTTGASNSAVGVNALLNNTTSSNNTSFGYQSLRNFNTSNNVAVGYEAVRGSTTVANNTGTSLVGVGYQALLANTSGNNGTAVGYQALLSNTTGNNNNAFGYQSLANNTTGANNAGFGYATLIGNTTASNNTAVGVTALSRFNTANNVAVGFEALRGGDATTANNTGANNIGIGYRAGDAITTGSNNIVIGYDIDPDSATGSSQINIGDRYFHDRIRLLERTSDPAKPTEGNMIVWMSDGTGLGDDGDVIIASTAGGVTNYAILFDHSAGTVWP